MNKYEYLEKYKRTVKFLEAFGYENLDEEDTADRIFELEREIEKLEKKLYDSKVELRMRRIINECNKHNET